MVTGMNNSEIAEKLVVSRSTVKYHVSNILSKLQAPAGPKPWPMHSSRTSFNYPQED